MDSVACGLSCLTHFAEFDCSESPQLQQVSEPCPSQGRTLFHHRDGWLHVSIRLPMAPCHFNLDCCDCNDCELSFQIVPGDHDCNSTRSRHPSGDVSHGDSLESVPLFPPAMHGFCLFLMHSQNLGVCIFLDIVGDVHILVCFLAVCAFSGTLSVFDHVCVYVCM